mgnify:FL=1
MEHLEFVDKLNEFGIQIHSTKRENIVQKIEIPNLFGEFNFVEIKNFQLNYSKQDYFSELTPLQAIIKEAIDLDNWKHSWHNKIEPDNYEYFREIIQDKILKRASEIEMLITVYFQLNHEISNRDE